MPLFQLFVDYSRNIFLLGPALGAILFILSCVYNLFFHPLRKYPGPFLARISPVWVARYWLSGRYHLHVKAAHDKYGPVVRIAPNEISFNSPGAWKDIYVPYQGRQPFLKSVWYDPLPGEPLSILSVREKDHHASMRKSLLSGFSPKAMAEQESFVHYFIDGLVRQLDKNCSKVPGDMVEWFNFATFDIIGDLTFGEPFGSVESGENHPWVHMIFQTLKVGAFFRSLRYFVLAREIGDFVIEYILPKKTLQAITNHAGYAGKKLVERTNKDLVRQDFFSKPIADMKEGKVTLEELQGQAYILLVGGSETTATALSGITYYLCRNPDKYKILTDELRNTFKNYRDITGSATERLPYLKAVIEEGLRLYPPVPIGLPRVSPGETVDGHWIPKGTVTYVSSWSATHSEKNFKNPSEFIPERWLDPDSTDKKEASQPFILGTRGCLGRSLANLELRLFVAKILWALDLRITDDNLDWVRDTKVFTLWDKPVMSVQVTRREGIAGDPFES